MVYKIHTRITWRDLPERPDGLLAWCLVANVARETAHGESSLDIQRGTKHFPAGTLLWIPPAPGTLAAVAGLRWAGRRQRPRVSSAASTATGTTRPPRGFSPVTNVPGQRT
ncbi:hypothetical protein ACFZAR_40940 [Streptomyces sp. NPDC008222]|uniref:hypothetical protein n=1 Tax=Streptomyces sp. NPDC008222 TaxID=3364820 RepID=UPI0036EBD5D2